MRLFTRLLSVAVAVTLNFGFGATQASGALPFPDGYFPFVDGEDPNASVSVGSTSNGYLVSGVPLKESDALAILPKQRKRSLGYASAELITPIAMDEELRFAIREGGRTVGAGVVTAIKE